MKRPKFNFKRPTRRTVAIGIGTLSLAWAAFAQVASELAESGRPDIAADLYPSNDYAFAQLGSLELARLPQLENVLAGQSSERQRTESTRRLASLSLKALRASPVQEAAYRNLAFVAMLEGDDAKALELAKVAERISRRDLATQVVLSRAALLDGNYAGGLRHIDAALRVSNEGRAQLYPAMAAAMSTEGFEDVFRSYVRADNDWLADFLIFAMGTEASAVDAARIIADAKDLPPRPGLSLREIAVAAAAASSEIKLARRIAGQLEESKRPAPDGGLSDPHFMNGTIPVPFRWIFTTDRNVTVRLPAGEGEVMQISSALPFSGELTRQLLTLRPGTYRLSFVGSLGENTGWNLRCRETASSLIEDVTAPSVRFTVPSEGCEAQWLRLQAKALGALSVELEEVAIKRVTARDS